MTLFSYKIIDKEGKKVSGEREAKDRALLQEELKKEGGTIVSLQEVSKHTLSFSFSFGSGVKQHDKIVFARNLSKMIQAGLPLTRGLSILERQSKGVFKKVLREINDSLATGVTLSDAMKKYPHIFSNLFVSMVRAGEESGNLSLALQNISAQMEKTYQLNKKIKGAMMYPAVIFSLMLVLGVLMMVYMVPTLTSTFIGLGIKLPLSTRIIIAISNFLKEYIIFLVIGLGVAGAAGISLLKTAKVKHAVDFILLHLPVIKDFVKQVNSARTARTLSSLLSSGVDIVVAIGVTKEVVQNSYYKTVLEEIGNTIQKGDPISSIFAKYESLYPVFVGEMVAVGEETGKISEMLSGIAEFYEEEVDQKTKNLSSIIEPILMILIGAGVGIFAISMLAPTYSLADAI